MIDWGVKYAAIYRSTKGMLKPVDDIDFVDIDSLYGLEKQKEILREFDGALDNKKNYKKAHSFKDKIKRFFSKFEN